LQVANGYLALQQLTADFSSELLMDLDAAANTSKNKVLITGLNAEQKLPLLAQVFGNVDWKNNTHFQRGYFTLDTKYYTAPVEFCLTTEQFVQSKNDPTLAELVVPPDLIDGFVVFCDSQVEGSWRQVLEWTEFLQTHRPSVALCVVSSLPSAEQVDWCINNQVELVELVPENPVEGEKVGMFRVLEALQNNMWENAVQKPRNSEQLSLFAGLEISDASQRLQPKASTLTTPNVSRFIPTGLLENLQASHEKFDLEAAITGLKSVRETASTLPDDERRALAATIALTFAKMLDGEDEEADSDSNNEEQ